MLRRIQQMEGEYGLRCANVFHAGDGNLHPLVLYDANKPGELDRAEAFGAEILRLCVEVGGVLTGEHGVGVEKRDLMDTMFTEIDLNQQQRLKCAFDSDGLLNPGKVFPQLCRCAELGRMHVRAGALRVSRSAAFLTGAGRVDSCNRRTPGRPPRSWPGRRAEGHALEIVAGGTKRALGRPMTTEHALDVSRLAGSSTTSPPNWC